MTAYHLAARYGRHTEMRDCRAQLLATIPGATVVSRWIDGHGRTLSEHFTPITLRQDRELCATYARMDREDVWGCNTVVLFTSQGDAGGRHADFAFGELLNRRRVVIGEPEHVYHCLPEVQWFPTFDDFLNAELSTNTRR